MIRPQHRTALLFAIAFVLLVYGLMWGLPNLFDFAQDSVVPTGELARQGFDFEKITSHRYPPFHFLILKTLFVPVRGLTHVAGISDNAKVAATLFILTARLVSVAMGLGAMWLIFLIGRRVWGNAAGYGSAWTFILSPLTLYYAKNANLDIPYVFWLACSLYYYVRILQENRAKDYAWLGLFAALAVCTKDQAYGFILLMPIPIIYRLWKRPDEETTDDSKFIPLICGAAAFLLPFVVIHNLILDWAGFTKHVQTIMGPGSEGWRLFTRGPVGQLRLLVETMLRLMDAWTPAGLVLVIIGLVVSLRRRDERSPLLWALLVPLAGYHLSFLAVVGYVPTRWVLPIMLVLSLFAGRGIIWLWSKMRVGSIPGKAMVVVLIGWVALAGLSLCHVMENFSRYDAQKWLEDNVPASARMVYMGEMRNMPRFNKPLDPQPCEATEQALAQVRPDVVVLSFGRGHPATGSACTRLSSILRRHLGLWGLTDAEKNRRTNGARSFHIRLLQGELGYGEVIRFESSIGPFAPEVSESVNRTIVIVAPQERP